MFTTQPWFCAQTTHVSNVSRHRQQRGEQPADPPGAAPDAAHADLPRAAGGPLRTALADLGAGCRTMSTFFGWTKMEIWPKEIGNYINRMRWTMSYLIIVDLSCILDNYLFFHLVWCFFSVCDAFFKLKRCAADWLLVFRPPGPCHLPDGPRAAVGLDVALSDQLHAARWQAWPSCVGPTENTVNPKKNDKRAYNKKNYNKNNNDVGICFVVLFFVVVFFRLEWTLELNIIGVFACHLPWNLMRNVGMPNMNFG